MNDKNLEEPSRYVDPLKHCHYLIDTDYKYYYGRDIPYSRDLDNWSIVHSLKYLDHQNSHTLFRAFYVPIFYETKCHFIDYNILRNLNLF